MWNDRFDTPDYVYGTAPSQFLTAQAHLLPQSGRALAIADGEGRNSVFLAERGLDVVAMDGAPNALAKARKLAETRGVTVDFHQADLGEWDWTPNAYDVVAAVFFQFAGPAFRSQIFAGIRQTLRPGGMLMLHGYTVDQLAHGTGGPREAENLYTADLLRDAFGDWDVLRLEPYEAVLTEGAGHSGTSALIDLVARKP